MLAGLILLTITVQPICKPIECAAVCNEQVRITNEKWRKKLEEQHRKDLQKARSK